MSWPYDPRMGLIRSSAILSLALAGCVAAPAARQDPDFRERLLATIPEGVRVDVPIAFSRDGRHAAYVARRGDLSRAVLGAWEGKPYQVI